jgi:hypothetical protein
MAGLYYLRRTMEQLNTSNTETTGGKKTLSTSIDLPFGSACEKNFNSYPPALVDAHYMVFLSASSILLTLASVAALGASAAQSRMFRMASGDLTCFAHMCSAIDQ